jgi:hypothetical protein
MAARYPSFSKLPMDVPSKQAMMLRLWHRFRFKGLFPRDRNARLLKDKMASLP